MRKTQSYGSVMGINDADPKLVKSLINALNSQLKKITSVSGPVVSFICPNCEANLGVSVKSSNERLKKSGIRSKRSNFASGVNKVVLQLAKLRGCMTGDIHRDFTKFLGAKANKLSKEEYRKKKLAWLSSEISKARRKRKAA